jgi:D-3-phosphoglycerate dehydrogenase
MKSGKCERSAFMGNELAGKILGVIGLGRIGREVAHRAKAFDMQIIGYDPLISKEFSAKMQIELVTLEELYKNSDFITIHVPLTDETKNLIGKKHFEMCKKGAKIINCSRGGIIDEKALYNAIQSGHIGGAALDVFEEEPLKDFSLVNVPNVIATPHLGASTEEAQEKVALEIAQQVADALKERGIKFAVNVVTVAPELVTFVRPYMKLGEKLGKLQAQIAEGTVQEINVEYAGEMLKYPVEPITSGIVKGIVKELVEEHVNEISAMAIAKERGLRILETKAPDSGGFTSLITVRLKTTEGESAISGTIFGKEKARMVHWNEFYIDSDLDGTFLVFSNMDKPGVVGKLGTILGKHNVNIAGISLGRSGPGGRALTMMNIDNIPSQEAIKEISELPEMFYVKIVNL